MRTEPYREHLTANIAGPLIIDVGRRVEDFAETAAVIDELDELVETGFRGREVERVEAMIESLGRIETDTDALAEDLATRQHGRGLHRERGDHA